MRSAAFSVNQMAMPAGRHSPLSKPQETPEGLYRFKVAADKKGGTLTVLSDPAHRMGYCIGNQLWSSAEELVLYFSRFPDCLFQGRRVLELGAGLGLPGQALLMKGAIVTFTDQSCMLDLLRRNLLENFGEGITDVSSGATAFIHELLWGKDLASLPMLHASLPSDLVIASEVCYDSRQYIPLIRTFQVVFAFPSRDESVEFLQTCAQESVGCRLLHVADKNHLVNPVNIVQLVNARTAQNVERSALAEEKLEHPQFQQKLLIVWDFDHSLIDVNSDPWVIDRLNAGSIFSRLRSQNEWGWTQLIDQTLLNAHTELGVSIDQIREACRTVALHPDIAEVIRNVAKDESVSMAIASDANSFFIKEILEAYGLQDCFESIFTNSAEILNGALRVHPYHGDDHGCLYCPSNLCKGQTVEELLLKERSDCVVYIGDGRGDYCPCTKLGSMDLILARKSYTGSESTCALLRELTSDGFRVTSLADALQRKSDPKDTRLEQNYGAGMTPVVSWDNSAHLASLLAEVHAAWYGKTRPS